MNRKQAVILDRDGVINDNRATIHVNRSADFVLLPAVGQAIRTLRAHGFAIMVATNQGGVGLGLMSERALAEIHQTMERQLAAQGAYLDAIAVCTHRPRADCSCRKPKPGLILSLQEAHGFDPAASVMVGDRETDVMAGQSAGLRTVFIGDAATDADYAAPSLVASVPWILQHVGAPLK